MKGERQSTMMDRRKEKKTNSFFAHIFETSITIQCLFVDGFLQRKKLSNSIKHREKQNELGTYWKYDFEARLASCLVLTRYFLG